MVGDDRPRMAFTDPPYNVDYGRHGGHQRGTPRRTIANDALAPVEWQAFVEAWTHNLLAATDGALYVCMSSREWPTLAGTFSQAGAHWSDTLIWAKDRFTLGRADYLTVRGHLVRLARRRRTASAGGRDQSNVWQVARPSDAPLHPVTSRSS